MHGVQNYNKTEQSTLWERNFEVKFGVFSVLVFQISVLESYLDIYLF